MGNEEVACMEYGVHSTRYTRLSDEQLYSMYRETAYSQLKEEEKLELIQETVKIYRSAGK